MVKLIQFVLIRLEKLEVLFFVLSFIAMLMIAVIEIIARNFFEISLYWSDACLRMLLLWITLLGAALAARYDKHIKVDFFDNYAKGMLLRTVKSLRCFVTALICAFIAYASYDFVATEYEYAEIAFLNVPVWLSAVIIPGAFFIMAFRYFVQSVGVLFHVGESHD